MIEVRKNSDGQVLGPRTERRTYDCQQMGWEEPETSPLPTVYFQPQSVAKMTRRSVSLLRENA